MQWRNVETTVVPTDESLCRFKAVIAKQTANRVLCHAGFLQWLFNNDYVIDTGFTDNPSPIQLRRSIVSYEIGPVIGFNRDRMISSDLLRSSFPLNRSLNQIRMFPTVGTILKCSTTHLSSATWPEMSHVHLTSSRLMLKNPFRINFAIISWYEMFLSNFV